VTEALFCARSNLWLIAGSSTVRRVGLSVLAIVLPALAATTDANAAAACSGAGAQVQVLGSGGPELQDKRASSSYLLWRNGKARVLVDAGGGSALRFGESGAQVTDLDTILFTHLHIDHTADFAALVKSSYFEERNRPLPVFGPAGNADFPSTTAFVAELFGPVRGAYRYLGEFVHGQDGGYRLQPRDVAPGPHDMQEIFTHAGLTITAATVIHGGVPALAFRIDADGRSFVFSGDTDGSNGNLEKLASNADVFVAHNAIPDDLGGPARALHMPPSVIGRIAHAATVRQLVLSHRMLRTLGRERETETAIARSYDGPIAFANDLDCFP